VFNPRLVGGFPPPGEQVIDIFVATHKALQYHAINSFAEVISSQNVSRRSCMPQLCLYGPKVERLE
jgi:DNA-binding helix-hairpin-helix protein with protein kinase domain